MSGSVYLNLYNNDPNYETSSTAADVNTIFRAGDGSYFNVTGSTNEVFKYLDFYDDSQDPSIDYVDTDPSVAMNPSYEYYNQYEQIIDGSSLTQADDNAKFTVTVTGGGTVNLQGGTPSTTFSGTVGTASSTLNNLIFNPAPNGATSTVTIEVLPNGNVQDTKISFFVYSFCFAKGTMIACPDGERPVEALKAGDLVFTVSGEARPISFLGYQTIDVNQSPDRAPVRIPVSTFADGVPSRDLLLSPDHAIMFENALIPARCLLGGAVVQEQCGQITYYHIQLDTHDVVLAEGLPCETLLETDDLSAFDNADEAVASLAFLTPCLPRLTQGPVVEMARTAIRSRLLQAV